MKTPGLIHTEIIDDHVDEWRRQQPDIPSRTVAIRRMVEIVAKGER